MNQSNQKIDLLVVIGATHGNELTGAYIAKHFEQFPHLIQRPSFETRTLLGNPKAFREGRRYIDKDLNRCFKSEDLQNLTLSSYEDKQARLTRELLTPKNKSQTSMIVDLHSTTANMGLTLILIKRHPLLLQLAAYLSSVNPEVKVLYVEPNAGNNFLISLSELSFAIEVGPVPQGVLNANLFQKTKELIHTTLDYVEAFNQGSIQSHANTLTLYKHLGNIDYPRDEHKEIQAMIHPQLQSKDYEPLNPGDPFFLTFDGKTIVYEGQSTVYPVFINEAAYYEKGVAMCLTEKQQITV
ncbi:aspartoacylase [Scytonema sp. NUACC21]